MKNIVKLIAPAKVNLVLAVGEKREDGFHKVDTVMHSLSLHDTLSMRRFEGDEGTGLVIKLTCECSGDIEAVDLPAEENLVYQAIVLLAEKLGRAEDEELEVSLSKVIPSQAGLGGGSSDAAAALLGAATLWGIDVDAPEVLAAAQELGSDVAFFLYGGCVRLSGKGEVFEGKLSPRRGFVLLVRPDAGVSTPAAYQAFDAAPVLPEADFLESVAAYENAADIVPWNNLAAAAETVTPELAEVDAWAKDVAGVTDVVLCGSGSAFCLMCVSYDAACAASVEAHKHGWWARVTSFSPLGASVVKAL